MARMGLFQRAPRTQEEIDQNKPLEIPPETVLKYDENEWYEKVYRGDATQLTVRAVIMGMVLGFFLSFTNLYIGLKTGWFLGVAVTACILSFSIWSALVRMRIAKTPMTILENTCMQSTASSAGYATGNTLVSAVAALLILSASEENPKGQHQPWWVLAPWVLCLAALGVVMAIPMKRNMINREKLAFPTGTAAAVTLQSLYSQGKEAILKARALFVALFASMLGPLLMDLEWIKKVGVDGKVQREALLPGHSNVFDGRLQIVAKQLEAKTGVFVEKATNLSQWYITLDHHLVLIGAGAFIGLRATISMVAGGLFLATVIGPRGMEWEWVNATGKLVTAATGPGTAWREIGIWYGAPLLVAYGLVTFGIQWKVIVRALTGLKGSGGPDRSDVEVPNRWFVWGMAIAGTGVIVIAWRFFSVPLHLGVLAVLMTFFLALVASRATGETDITPGGPLGKIVQLTYGVLIPQKADANLMTAAVTSGGSLASADLLSDLKSGYLLGANPRRQFVAQFLGIFVGTAASVTAFFILVPDATALTGVAGKDPTFAAPGAQQWKAVAELFNVGVQNLHPMAREGMVWGLVWGAALAIAEAVFPKQRQWIPSATGIGLGLLLPFLSPLSMFLGALIAWIFKKASPKQGERFTIPIASGLIAGESIMGVVVAGLNNFVLK
jgi:uncharacterized oligopeptide transporter (OPT) family protein